MSHDLKQKYDALIQEIQAHDYRYYVLDDPQIDDREYDARYAQLRVFEAEHPELLSPTSPTQRVGAGPQRTLRTVPHVTPMMSLDNTYSEGDLSEFLRRVQAGLSDGTQVNYCVEPKLDGASVELIYRAGQLVGGSTRCDGKSGEEILENLRTI